MAVMARLLSPADFGLIAIANVSLRFFTYFAQMGIAPALIQKPTLDDADIRAALAISMAISGFFFLIAMCSAALLERFFAIPNLGLVTQVLAFNFVVTGFSSVSAGLMRRNNSFKQLALIEILSYVLGYGLVGIIAANLGAGVWALVAAFMTQSGLTALLSYLVTRHSLQLRHSQSQRKHFLSYGGRYSLIGFVEFLTSNIDALVIGKVLGQTSAGIYNRALLLANLPVQQPANVLTRVLFPIMSSIGNEHQKQSCSLQLGMLLVGCYAFAVSSGIFAAAPLIVKVLLGDAWADAIPILKILALSVGPIYVSHVISVTLNSLNQLQKKLNVQLIAIALMISLVLLATHYKSLEYMAAAVVATEWCRLIMMIHLISKTLNITKNELLKIFGSIIVISVIAYLSVTTALSLLGANIPHIPLLLFCGLAGAFGFICGLYIAINIVSEMPAILFLRNRMTVLDKIFRKLVWTTARNTL